MMPFASCEPIDERPDVVSQADAKRLWELNSSDGLDPSRPEYRMILDFVTIEDASGDFDWMYKPGHGISERDAVYRFLDDTNSERGKFRAFVLAARKYLCSDPEVRDSIERARAKSRRVCRT